MAEVGFRKSGREIKEAISRKIVGLQQRLEKRNESLDRFLDERKKARSFVVRSGLMQVSEHYRGGGMALYPKGDISREELSIPSNGPAKCPLVTGYPTERLRAVQ